MRVAGAEIFKIRQASKPRFFIAMLVTVAAVAAMLCGMTGCADTDAKDAEGAIRDGIDADMGTLQALTTDEASAMFDSDFTQRLTEAGIDPAAVYGPLFSRMTYSIDGVTVDMSAGTATASVTVTNIDIAQALDNYSEKLTDYLYEQTTSASSANSDQDHIVRMADLLSAALNEESLGTVTTAVNVDYRLEDGNWVMQDGTDLRRAILAGMDPATISARIGS